MKNEATREGEVLGHASSISKLGIVICALVLSSALTATADDQWRPPIARTESGIVIGSRVNGVNEFLGIPYAAPPTGSRRWTPPQPYGYFPGFVLHASQFGGECTQPGGVGSEDCLFLNVFAPAREDDEDESCRLPVMVWIHGGGLVLGSSDSYDPTPLVKKRVVVVTMNYRLGYLGFFAHSSIDAEGHLNGNYGLMDQQFALKWVQRNIRAFCGDPSRVTIFGESGGGQSVYAQVASPLAAGLFHGAISESGAYLEFQDYFPNIIPLGVAEGTGASIAENLGCAIQTAACLRDVPASTLVDLEPFPVFPLVDGALLTQTISDAFASGEFNRVPVISGGNHDEDRLFVAFDYDLSGSPLLSSTDYETAVTAQWGPDLQPIVLALYPLMNYPSAGEALGASGTDGVFNCPLYRANQSLSKFVSTYAYEFNDENAPPSQALFGGALTFPLGAYHTAELQYLFAKGDFFGVPLGDLSRKQAKLSAAMISYWTQFAKTGNPNSPNRPAWIPFTTSNEVFQSLIPPNPIAELNFDAAHKCSAFWDTF